MEGRIDINIDRIITKILQRKANEYEKGIFNNWIDSSPENQAIFEQLEQTWQNSNISNKAVAEEELIDKIWQSAKIKSKSNTYRTIRKPLILWKFAASIAITAAVYFSYKNNTAAEEPTAISFEEVIKMNGSGQKSKIHLLDGTVVWLNAESSITYKKPFDTDRREVELVGEAYFEVAKDSTKPFIVHFNGSNLKVLGTSFNISSYQEDNADVVSLVEGKIDISHGLKNQILSAGWISEIDPETGQLKSYEGKVEDNISWINDIILFKESSYEEIFTKLERWYGVQIITSGSPNQRLKFNGSFKDETLENILENLVLEDKLNYRIDKEHVYVTFN